MNSLFISIAATLTSFLISYFLTFPTIVLAKKTGLVTDKRKRKHPAHTHKGIIPRGGGVPIFLSILISSLLFMRFNKILIGIMIADFIVIVMGLFDDYYDLSPYLRFVINILTATIVVAFGLGIPFISNPFGGVIHLDSLYVIINFLGHHKILILADIFAIIWLAWTTNMVNWSKGVDGQLPGFVAITAFFLGLIANRFSAHSINAHNVALLSFIVAGAFAGFTPHNFYPQKIMPGYSGGALAGFMLGILSLLSFGKVGTAVLILALPTIDAIYTIIRRIKNKKSPFRADWGHFHHRLLDIGWGKKRIAVFYWIIALILGTTTLIFDREKKVISFASFSILLLIFIILTIRIKKTQSR